MPLRVKEINSLQSVICILFIFRIWSTNLLNFLLLLEVADKYMASATNETS